MFQNSHRAPNEITAIHWCAVIEDGRVDGEEYEKADPAPTAADLEHGHNGVGCPAPWTTLHIPICCCLPSFAIGPAIFDGLGDAQRTWRIEFVHQVLAIPIRKERMGRSIQ